MLYYQLVDGIILFIAMDSGFVEDVMMKKTFAAIILVLFLWRIKNCNYMLKGILSISGQAGLFKLVSQAKNSIIVESLIDGKRFPAYSTSRVSALEDISIYTEEGDVKLSEILLKIYAHTNGGEAPTAKASAQELKNYFESVVPNYDKDRVYVSDIKKVLSWYNLLASKNLIDPAKAEQETLDSEENA